MRSRRRAVPTRSEKRSSGGGGTARSLLAAALGGALLLAALQIFFVATWEWWRPGARLDRPWLLASRGGILVTQISLFVTALASGLRHRGAQLERLWKAGAMAGGFLAAAAALFLAVGPEKLMTGAAELWPLTLLSLLLLTAPAIGLGAGLAAYLRRER